MCRISYYLLLVLQFTANSNMKTFWYVTMSFLTDRIDGAGLARQRQPRQLQSHQLKKGARAGPQGQSLKPLYRDFPPFSRIFRFSPVSTSFPGAAAVLHVVLGYGSASMRVQSPS